MCEIVVCVSGPGVAAPLRYQDGDVIDVLPDGWTYGQLELSNPNWRIFKFPGVDTSVFRTFLQMQVPNPQAPNAPVWRRGTSFNYAALSTMPSVSPNAVMVGKISPYIADTARTSSTLSVPLAAADVPTMAVVKVQISAGVVIGTPVSSVIG